MSVYFLLSSFDLILPDVLKSQYLGLCSDYPGETHVAVERGDVQGWGAAPVELAEGYSGPWNEGDVYNSDLVSQWNVDLCVRSVAQFQLEAKSGED